MKQIRILFTLCCLFSIQVFSQSSSATYNSGDIETDIRFIDNTDSSLCSGLLSVSIPTNAVITGVDVEYDMTAMNNGWKSDQRSQLWCTSPGGIEEPAVYAGSGTTGGTLHYSRTGLDIANGVPGGGNINFELHAGRIYGGSGCNTVYNYVDDGTWTVTVYYIAGPGYPYNPDPVDDSTEVALNGHLKWDFATDTDTFDLWFGPLNNMVEVASDEQAADTGFYTFTGLEHSSTYQWQVLARNEIGTSNGPVWQFTTTCLPYSSFPFTEDFDDWVISSPGTTCTPDSSVSLFDCWINATGDSIDWDVFTGATGSESTGPSGDHTTGAGIYLYTEASACFQQTGWVYSPEFDFTGVFPSLSFWYHMYGANMGSLSVHASLDGGSSWSEHIITLKGDFGNAWRQATVGLGLLENESSVIFRFSGITGSGFTSDMAIDDFRIDAWTDPVAWVYPLSVDYGECPLNNFTGGYYTRNFLVENMGPDTLTVSSIALAGTNTASFVLADTNSYPIELSDTAQLTFDVSLDPSSIGDKTAEIQVTHSEGVSTVPLSGEAYVARPQALTGTANITYGIDLDWDPPMPEGEVRYDNGYLTSFARYDTCHSNDYLYTRLTTDVAGYLNTVALFCRTVPGGSTWNEVLVCPDDGTGKPDMASPYEIFSDVAVTSTTGQWIILDLAVPESLSAGDDFYILVRWQEGSTVGPAMALNNNINYGRCAYTRDAGTNWFQYNVALIMRAYMSATAGSMAALGSGELQSGRSEIPDQVIDSEIEENGLLSTSYILPGIYETVGNRDLMGYTISQGNPS